ncbi:MAG: hypothetical protein ACRYFS_14970, partial [Janthinobacterium lividum]
MEHGTSELIKTTGNVAEIIGGFTSPAPPSLGDYRFGAHLTSYLKALIEASPLNPTERGGARGAAGPHGPPRGGGGGGGAGPPPRPP